MFSNSCRRGGSRGGRNNNNRAPKKDVTAMDLDAEMDAYMAADVNDGLSVFIIINRLPLLFPLLMPLVNL